MHGPGFRALRIAGFALISADAARLARFYVTAFGARPESNENLSATRIEREFGVRGGSLCHHLKFGEQAVDILEFETPGKPYPRHLTPYSTAFQHFAIVVSDMPAALSQLQRTSGWTAISDDGPQHLPQRSGGVTAFKFLDPDGHPLEFLQFPDAGVPSHWKSLSQGAIFLGIDHSAISVRDTALSTTFYQSLGFSVSAESLNHGAEQAHLDGVPDPHVEVTALSPPEPTPHLELLCYRTDARASPSVLASNDVAATQIYLAAEPPEESATTRGTSKLIVDPDGHHLRIDS